MRVRHYVREPKIIANDSGWRTDDIPPRFSGIYEKSRPNRGTWRWRSVLAKASEREYIFLTQINEPRDEWKAWLVVLLNPGASIVSRYEYHGSHAGIHVHSHCELAGEEPGPQLINNLVRIPDASSYHRRQLTLRPGSFWETARKHFRIEFPTGDLL